MNRNTLQTKLRERLEQRCANEKVNLKKKSKYAVLYNSLKKNLGVSNDSDEELEFEQAFSQLVTQLDNRKSEGGRSQSCLDKSSSKRFCVLSKRSKLNDSMMGTESDKQEQARDWQRQVPSDPRVSDYLAEIPVRLDSA